jgi:hypothetical protein
MYDTRLVKKVQTQQNPAQALPQEICIEAIVWKEALEVGEGQT